MSRPFTRIAPATFDALLVSLLLIQTSGCAPPPPPDFRFAEAVPIYTTEDFDIPAPSGQWREVLPDDRHALDLLLPLAGRLGFRGSTIGFCRVSYDRPIRIVGYSGGWVDDRGSCFSVNAYRSVESTPANDSDLVAIIREANTEWSQRGAREAIPFAGLAFTKLTNLLDGKVYCGGLEGQALVRVEESRGLVVWFQDSCAGPGSGPWRAAERARIKPAP